MKNIRKRTLSGSLLLTVLVILFGTIIFFANWYDNMLRDSKEEFLNVQSFGQSLEKVDALSLNVYNSLIEYRTTKTRIAAMALEDPAALGREEQLFFFMNGCTVKVLDNRIVEVPEGFPEDVPVKDSMIYDETGWSISSSITDGSYLVSYSRVNGPYYYIEWEPYDEIWNELKQFLDTGSLIQGLEQAFMAKIILISQNSSDRFDTNIVFYASEGLPQYNEVSEYGITDDSVRTAIAASGNRKRQEKETDGSDGTSQEKKGTVGSTSGEMMQIGGEVYEAYGYEVDNLGYVMLILFPNKDSLLLSCEQSMILTVLMVSIGIVFITWIVSILLMVRDHALDENQKTMFNPSNLGRRSWIMVLCGLLCVILIAALSRSMFNAYKRASGVEHSLDVIEEKIDENRRQSRVALESMKMKHLQYARYVRDIFTEDPGLCTSGNMQKICDMTGAGYIMLFDEKGNETISNSPLINLSLGESEDSQTTDFRLLLNGVEEIVQDPSLDEATGLDAALIGVSYTIDESKPVYGALITAVPTETILSVGAQDPSELMKLMVAEDSICFSLDEESGRILDASDEELIGEDAALLGLPKSAQHDSFMDYFRLNGTDYFGESSEKDGILYYYATERRRMYSDIPVYMIICAIGYLIVMIPLNLFMRHGYAEDYDIYKDMGDVLPENEDIDLVSVPDGRVKRSVDPARRWLRFGPNRHAGMPIRNAMMMVRLLFAVWMILIVLLIGTRRIGTSTDSSVLAYILRGSWAEGVNIFAFANIFILFCETAMAVILAGWILRILSTILGTRGETVCRLLLNMIRYLAVIAFAYFGLAYLGFNTNALLASLGLLTFAISLGAKDLITDILAGISIVFEGEYQVGDIIEVNGYRGMVLEIGVRTTKLEGRGGNIKIIANRDVKNVLNMTRKNSWYPVELNVACDSEHPIEEIEKELSQRLKTIGEQIPEIISGPYYKGVVGIGNGFVTLSIIAECTEEDYHLVQRELNRALQVFLEECDIRLK